MSKEKVVLAYSGGLDTSVCIKWLQEEKGLDVICVLGNVGQELHGLEYKKQKALDLGVIDACARAQRRVRRRVPHQGDRSELHVRE